MYEEALKASRAKLAALKQAELDRLDNMVWDCFENRRMDSCRVELYTADWDDLLDEICVIPMYSANSNEEIIYHYEPYFNVSTSGSGDNMRISLELTAQIVHDYQVQFKIVESTKKRFPWSKPITVTEKVPATAYDRLVLSYQHIFPDEFIQNLIVKNISESLDGSWDLPLTHPAAYSVMHFIDESNELEYWQSTVNLMIHVRVKIKFRHY